MPSQIHVTPRAEEALLSRWGGAPESFAATMDLVQAINAKPQDEWTDAERAFMAAGVEWASSTVDALIEAFEAPAAAFAAAMIGVGQAASFAVPRITSVFVSMGELMSDDTTTEPEAALEFDQFRHVSGLPGVSDRCWADVWDEEEEDYVACNAEATNDLGTCDDHRL